MVAVHAELSERGAHFGKQRCERVDVVGAHADEVAAEEEDVRLERVEGGTGLHEHAIRRGGAGVEVRRERHTQCTRSCAPRCANLLPVHLQGTSALESERIEYARGPVHGTKELIEHHLDAATFHVVAAIGPAITSFMLNRAGVVRGLRSSSGALHQVNCG